MLIVSGHGHDTPRGGAVQYAYFPGENGDKKICCVLYPNCVYLSGRRGVAQPGRVLAWGARGRRFDSCHPDQKIKSAAGRFYFLAVVRRIKHHDFYDDFSRRIFCLHESEFCY